MFVALRMTVLETTLVVSSKILVGQFILEQVKKKNKKTCLPSLCNMLASEK